MIKKQPQKRIEIKKNDPRIYSSGSSKIQVITIKITLVFRAYCYSLILTTI